MEQPPSLIYLCMKALFELVVACDDTTSTATATVTATSISASTSTSTARGYHGDLRLIPNHLGAELIQLCVKQNCISLKLLERTQGLSCSQLPLHLYTRHVNEQWIEAVAQMRPLSLTVAASPLIHPDRFLAVLSGKAPAALDTNMNIGSLSSTPASHVPSALYGSSYSSASITIPVPVTASASNVIALASSSPYHTVATPLHESQGLLNTSTSASITISGPASKAVASDTHSFSHASRGRSIPYYSSTTPLTEIHRKSSINYSNAPSTLPILDTIDPIPSSSSFSSSTLIRPVVQSLQSLTIIPTVALEPSNHILQETLIHFKNLHTLCLNGHTKLSNLSLAHIAANLNYLQHVLLRNCDKISGAGIASLSILQHIQSLDLSFCTKITGEALRPLANMTSLRALYLKGCTRVTNNSLAYISNLSNLQILDCAGCSKLDDDGFLHLKRLSFLTYLNVSETHMSGKLLATIIAQAPRLKHIKASRCDALPIGIQDIESTLKNSHCVLNTLKLVGIVGLHDHNLLHLNHLLVSLRSLNLSGCRYVGDTALSTWLPLTNLVDLSLSGTRVTEFGIASIAHSSFKNLISLDLGGLFTIGQEALRIIANNAPRLQTLNLERISLSSSALVALAPLASTLTELNLDGCRSISNSGVFLITSSLQNLAVLRLANTSVSDAGIMSLSSLKHLTTLSLRGLSGITAVGLSTLLGLEKLQNLDLSRCANIGDAACSILGDLFPFLYNLSCKECSEITEEGLQTLIESLDQLESLDIRGCPYITEDSVTSIIVKPDIYEKACLIRTLKFDCQCTVRNRLENPVSDLYQNVVKSQQAFSPSLGDYTFSPSPGEMMAQSMQANNFDEYMRNLRGTDPVQSTQGAASSSAKSKKKKKKKEKDSMRGGINPLLFDASF